MESARFDEITKWLARRRVSRRAAIASAGSGFAATGLGALHGRAAAQEASPSATPAGEAERPTSFLFVQTAAGGSLRPNGSGGTPEADGTVTPGGGADYLLTLEGHGGTTVYFSDRPERLFGLSPTPQFLEGLGFTPVNPPNAALVAQTPEGEEVVVLELVDPTYDEATGQVTYGANILSEYAGEGLAPVADQQADTALPEAFTHAALFIDDCPNKQACCQLVHDGIVYNIGNITINTCYSVSKAGCLPCRTPSDYAAICGQIYPICAGECYLDPGWWETFGIGTTC